MSIPNPWIEAQALVRRLMAFQDAGNTRGFNELLSEIGSTVLKRQARLEAVVLLVAVNAPGLERLVSWPTLEQMIHISFMTIYFECQGSLEKTLKACEEAGRNQERVNGLLNMLGRSGEQH